MPNQNNLNGTFLILCIIIIYGQLKSLKQVKVPRKKISIWRICPKKTMRTI